MSDSSRGPGLAFVASDVNAFGHPIYERLRHAIFTARTVCRWPHDVYVINVGLTQDQADALRRADVRVVNVLHDAGNPPRYPLRQKFMYKAWADAFVPLADPLIVADCDLEFREPGVLEELVRVAAGGWVFIVEELYRWRSNLNVFLELRAADCEKAACVFDTVGSLHDLPILNAGLFGGPRALLRRVLHWVRLIIPGLLDTYHWFWEQLALSHVLAQPEFSERVAKLPTEYNWITHWGVNAAAKVLHFSGEALAEARLPMPEEYLRAEGAGETQGKLSGVVAVRA